jgi:hypothetical protein
VRAYLSAQPLMNAPGPSYAKAPTA